MSPRLPLTCMAVIASVGLSLTACGPKTPQATLHETMTTTIAPQAQILWDIPNKALDDNGDVDGAKLTTDDWAQVLLAGKQMQAGAQTLADAKELKVAAGAVTLAQEENPGAAKQADVQRYIDADPKGFAKFSAALATAGGEFVSAAQAKDGKKLGEVSDRLDQVCEQCHLEFWYPKEAADHKAS